MVQRLRLGDQQPTDEDIQKKLDEVFKGQEQIKTNSLYSVKSFRGLAVAKSQISLEPQLRASFIEGYQNDTRWADILIELQSDPQKKTIIQGRKRYRLSSKLLEFQDQEEGNQTWRIVVPNDPAIKGRIMEELHSVPYAGHLGYQKTLKQFRRHFTGQTSPLKSEIMYWVVRSAKRKRTSVGFPQAY